MNPILEPECYKRHAEIENHIDEGKFWRATIIGAVITFSCVLIGQYNMSIQNDRKMIEANAKLTQMVEINTKRIDNLENLFPRIRGERGPQGIQGEPGKDGKNAE